MSDHSRGRTRSKVSSSSTRYPSNSSNGSNRSNRSSRSARSSTSSHAASFSSKDHAGSILSTRTAWVVVVEAGRNNIKTHEFDSCRDAQKAFNSRRVARCLLDPNGNEVCARSGLNPIALGRVRNSAASLVVARRLAEVRAVHEGRNQQKVSVRSLLSDQSSVDERARSKQWEDQEKAMLRNLVEINAGDSSPLSALGDSSSSLEKRMKKSLKNARRNALKNRPHTASPVSVPDVDFTTASLPFTTDDDIVAPRCTDWCTFLGNPRKMAKDCNTSVQQLFGSINEPQ